MHGKLLTNHHRMIRGANVWNHLPSVHGPQTNNLEEWRNWLHTNINHSSAQSGVILLKCLL
ncbi:hypothetical protein RHMOL_Rhmol07G0130900 [Rhododendron molle]|uniref:Uncharacterized protein n=1 Tax=Rhododendron molle TaxID=49168 RepID=A0ACC0N171_RHOML|nr:hypothetical protein RHMOL_Rhmol07G0130900 [Rhododendron molle]